MKYTSVSHIKSVEDVKTFFHHLVNERKLNFHPDDDFADYICYKDKTPYFSKQEISVYNRLMDESFDVCEKAEVDIYEIGYSELMGEITLIRSN